MPEIKRKPEDFIVREIFEKETGEDEGRGYYVWFTLKRKNWDLFQALRAIAKKLGVSIKRFGYAGVKDKRAVAYQRISVWNVPVEKLKALKIKDMELSDFEIRKERINLGDLKANQFEIVIRDIGKDEKDKIEKNLERIKREGFVNYFGEQRFGFRGNTHLVGKAILKNNLKEAVWIYLAGAGERNEEARKFRELVQRDFISALKACPKHLRYEKAMLNHLISNPNDYAGALRKLPKKLRRMFVHAYQAYLWNEIARISKEKRIPMIGFRTDIEKYKDREKIREILKREGVSPENFQIRSMPELSSEGSERERIVKPKGMEWEFGEDELNEGKIKCTLKFEIPKGSYATVLINEVTEMDEI